MGIGVARNISNSEVVSWLTCRQQYNFAYVQELAPKVEKTAISRGNIGHLAFQRYIEARIDGKSHEAAMSYALQVFLDTLQATENVEMVLQTQFLFNNYMQAHKGWPEWKLLSTEQRFDLPLTDQFNISIRYDVMVEEIATGAKLIGDWKFTYDFWTPEEHSINAQMPKYIAVMNANGHNVAGGFLEEVRTRKLAAANQSNPKMAWRRTPYYPSKMKQRNALKQHISASLEIDKYRTLPLEQMEMQTIPVLSKHQCKGCFFIDLCGSKFDGGELDVMIELQFKQNTYGYNFDEVRDLL